MSRACPVQDRGASSIEAPGARVASSGARGPGAANSGKSTDDVLLTIDYGDITIVLFSDKIRM